ncbi:hypothetical protein H5410_001272 [Solanum commersonii]|uniref:Uncharacterized protein n=1 Tax=Solanum commersonii TaxID=4109 RepID=A0A9J6AZ76_SOLCO|nr:hypothetical protein H5410_001272 [Solanum commersonii]
MVWRSLVLPVVLVAVLVKDTAIDRLTEPESHTITTCSMEVIRGPCGSQCGILKHLKCKNLDFIEKRSSLIKVDQLFSSEVERYCFNFILLHGPKRYECLALKNDVISSPLLRDLQSSNTSYSHGVLELQGDI